MIELTVHREVEHLVRPGLLVARDVQGATLATSLDQAIAETERALRESCELGHVVSAVRAMYRRFGVDPTKTRPSSEALLRRLRRGESLPRINAIVDVGNWCSVETQLPYGLYDLDRVEGPIELRLGRDGEEYAGIRKDLVHVAGRLVVADGVGPFGNPTSDSERTSVSDATRRVLLVIYAPAAVPDHIVEHAVAVTGERVTHYLGGEIVPVRVCRSA